MQILQRIGKLQWCDFLSGLNKEIANIIELHHYIELEDMGDMDIKVVQKGT